MEMRTGGAPGAAGEGDDIARLHGLTDSRQELRAVIVQRGKSIAVIYHHIVSIATGVVLRVYLKSQK